MSVPVLTFPRTRIVFHVAAALLALTAVPIYAQQSPATPAAPSAAPKEAPRWQQGRPPEMANSPLAPIAPHLTGRPASELPIDKLKVPPGFKAEVWVDGAGGALPGTRRQRHGFRQ
jgi:hypothetical protein